MCLVVCAAEGEQLCSMYELLSNKLACAGMGWAGPPLFPKTICSGAHLGGRGIGRLTMRHPSMNVIVGRTYGYGRPARAGTTFRGYNYWRTKKKTFIIFFNFYLFNLKFLMSFSGYKRYISRLQSKTFALWESRARSSRHVCVFGCPVQRAAASDDRHFHETLYGTLIDLG